MAQASRTFRIFVSSTFSDLKAERNALQRYVFPRLRDLCLQHGCRFQAIDLRWGVSEEAALDQQTMTICLDEIARCRRTSPRPNFIVLLGDRYGWRPLPPKVPAREFDLIAQRISGEERGRLTEWYLRDDNAIPPEYCLKPRTPGGPYEDYAAWAKVEQNLMDILQRAVQGIPLEDYDRLKYGASATEQEIARGALLVPDAPEHVFGFFRTIRDLPHDRSAAEYVDLGGEGSPDREAQERLNSLKARLRRALPDNIHEYEAGWVGKDVDRGSSFVDRENQATSQGVVEGTNDERRIHPTNDSPDRSTALNDDHIGTLPETLEACLHLNEDGATSATLCVDVWRRLSGVLLREFAQIEQVDPLEKEAADHRAFGAERARFFTGRAEALRAIGDYLGDGGQAPLLVSGPSGSGKSALMGRAAQQAQADHPDAHVVLRFIGITPGSSDGRSLLENLCLHVSGLYSADASTVPGDYQELCQEFPKQLSLATAEHPLIVFLDALDQLPETDPARNLNWLPVQLPDHVHLIASLLPDDRQALLSRRLPEGHLITLDPMRPEEGRALLDHWLKDAGRTLQPHQRANVLGNFERNGLPLYLKLAFEEAQRWKSYEALPTGADGIPGLSPAIEDMIADLLWRLEQPSAHGETLVNRALSYLAASKNGLTEDEILDALSRDREVLSDFRRRSPRSPAVDRLPVVLWSRLYLDMEPYLTERAAEGATLLTFYHRQLAEAVAARYLAGEARQERHRALAGYFGDQALEFQTGDQVAPNVRKLVELPYQQTRAEQWDDLFATLTGFRFLERKAASVGIIERKDTQGKVTRAHTGVFQVQGDYDLALGVFGGAEAQAGGSGQGGTRLPIIVTAVDFGQGPVVRCPSCLQLLPLHEEWLDNAISCPRSGCQGRMRVNPFVAGRKRP